LQRKSYICVKDYYSSAVYSVFVYVCVFSVFWLHLLRNKLYILLRLFASCRQVGLLTMDDVTLLSIVLIVQICGFWSWPFCSNFYV